MIYSIIFRKENSTSISHFIITLLYRFPFVSNVSKQEKFLFKQKNVSDQKKKSFRLSRSDRSRPYSLILNQFHDGDNNIVFTISYHNVGGNFFSWYERHHDLNRDFRGMSVKCSMKFNSFRVCFSVSLLGTARLSRLVACKDRTENGNA